MSDEKIFRINKPNVTSEEIDGEVIIINLTNGNYYSAVGVAAYLWGRLERDTTVGRTCDELLESFPEQQDSIPGDVTQFLEKLESEELIVRKDKHESPNKPTHDDMLVNLELPTCYSVPVLNCYTDMQDLLLLDPIHDVEDAGWPVAKPASGK